MVGFDYYEAYDFPCSDVQMSLTLKNQKLYPR